MLQRETAPPEVGRPAAPLSHHSTAEAAEVDMYVEEQMGKMHILN